MTFSVHQPMRVLFVQQFGLTMAGGETWIRNLASALNRDGRITVIAALHVRGPLFAALVEGGITVVRTPLAFLRGRPRIALLSSTAGVISSAVRLAAIIRGQHIQIVHAFSPEAAESAFLACRLMRVPLVLTIMNCGTYPIVDEAVLRRVDRVIAISSAVEHDVRGAGVSPQRIVRIPLGISFDLKPTTVAGALHHELGLSLDTPLIGMVANLEPKKAQDVLIRAVPAVLVSEPGAHIVLLGRDKLGTQSSVGPYERQLRNLVQELGLADRVHFLGFRPDAVRYMSQFASVVLCSRREAQGLAAVEAMAVGVPVVATAVEGLLDVVQDGRTGLLVPPDDPAALAHALICLLRDPQRARSLGASAKQEVRERYDALTLAHENMLIYEQLLEQKQTEAVA